MKIALAQRNYIVADLAGNAERIAAAVRDAQARGAGLVVTSELALAWATLRVTFCCSRHSWPAAGRFSSSLPKSLRAAPPVLVGIAEPNPSQGRPLYNSAALIHNGRIGRAFPQVPAAHLRCF